MVRCHYRPTRRHFDPDLARRRDPMLLTLAKILDAHMVAVRRSLTWRSVVTKGATERCLRSSRICRRCLRQCGQQVGEAARLNGAGVSRSRAALTMSRACFDCQHSLGRVGSVSILSGLGYSAGKSCIVDYGSLAS